jgi:LemA protein
LEAAVDSAAAAPAAVGDRARESVTGEETMTTKRLLSRARPLALLVLIALHGCGYNTLVSQGERVDAAWSEIDNQLQRRNDLIPNLVETVKGFAAQEKDVLLGVTKARSHVADADTPDKKIEASNELSGALSRLLVVVERYPELKSDQNFIRLHDELAGTENRIAVARMRYNEEVRAYNTTAKRFPTNLVASLFGFHERPYFEAPETAKEVPKVQF